MKVLDHDRAGVASALTTFAPIIPGHEETVRALIESLPQGERSPFARLPQLHCSRLHILHELVHQGGNQKRDELASSYLVFTSSYDGELDDYLDTICDAIAEDADAWWGHCVAYPGTADRAAFKRYIRSHHRKTSLFAAAYPAHTVQEVREALELRQRVVDFVAATQGLPADELQRRFDETFAEVA